MRKPAVVVLLILSLVLSACGPAMQPATDTAEGGEVFVLALPRIVVDFDATGTPSVLGLKLSDLAPVVGSSVSNLRLHEFYVGWMTAANVQHVELRQTGRGVALLVNGKALPHIGWDDASLREAGDLASAFNVPTTDLVKKLLPMVRRLGLDIVLRFPRQSAAPEIAMADPTAPITVTAPATAPAPSAVVKFEVKYDANGVPGILGITASDLSALGVNLSSVVLSPNNVRLIQSKNIQTVELRGRPDGLYLYINGEPLPNVVWDDAFLGNAAELYAQTNPGSPYIPLARQLIPMVNKADIDVLVHFPLAAGAQPVPAKMH
jgi:hypothetical protein